MTQGDGTGRTRAHDENPAGVDGRRPGRGRAGRGPGLLVGAAVVVAVPVLLAVLAMGALTLVHRGEALPGARLATVDLSGQGRADLTRSVTAYAKRLGGREITLTTPDGRSTTVTPAGVGFVPDVAATVDAALQAGRTGSVLNRLGAELPWTGAPRVHLQDRVDHAELAAAVDAAADQADQQRRTGGFTVDGTSVTTVVPQDGFRTDRAAAVDAVRAALSDVSVCTVALPGTASPSGVDPASVTAVADQARQRLRSDLTLADGPHRLVLTPAELGGLLVAKVGGSPPSGAHPATSAKRPVSLAVRDDALAELIDSLATQDVDTTPVDATFSTSATGGTPRLDTKGTTSWTPVAATASVRQEGSPGLKVDRKATTAAARAALLAGDTTAPMTVTTTAPAVTADDAAKITELIGTFTTYYKPGQPRVTNIHRMAQIVDDTVVAPGGHFSLNRKAGRRTTEKGFVADGAIVNGELEDQVGGGVSQFSTTMFNAVFFAGLKIDSHQPHSFYISRYPPGREATLNYPTIDNRWTNNTDAPVVVRTAYTSTSITVALYGDNGGLTVTGTTGERQPRPDGGFTIDVVRTTSDGGREKFHTVYNPPPAGE